MHLLWWMFLILLHSLRRKKHLTNNQQIQCSRLCLFTHFITFIYRAFMCRRQCMQIEKLSLVFQHIPLSAHHDDNLNPRCLHIRDCILVFFYVQWKIQIGDMKITYVPFLYNEVDCFTFFFRFSIQISLLSLEAYKKVFSPPFFHAPPIHYWNATQPNPFIRSFIAHIFSVYIFCLVEHNPKIKEFLKEKRLLKVA